MAYERKQIPLANLRLNTANDRHGPVTSEHECIQWLLYNHREHMVNLAKDIVEHGLSPIDGILVLPLDDGASNDYAVWEGNRRVAALKLLDDSNRCHDEKLRRRFSEIRGTAKGALPAAIECTVAPSEEAADRLIELRHQGAQEGVGTVAWDAMQKERHQQRRGRRGRYAYSRQVLGAVSEKLDPDLQTQVQDASFPISTLDRILKNASARKFLGLADKPDPELAIEQNEHLKGLSKILRDVANGMPVGDVYNDKLIRKYLNGFRSKYKPNTSKKLAAPVSLAGGTMQVAKGTATRSRPSTRDRKKLIAGGVSYNVKHKRLNSIYLELRRIDVDLNTNAVAVLFRVFLELGVDVYLSNHRIQVSQNDKLHQKARKVVNHMTASGWIDDPRSKGINTALDSTHKTHAVDTFHAYVHNPSFHPSPVEVKTAFDNLEPFFEVLFKGIR